jgi:hypothetical protein
LKQACAAYLAWKSIYDERESIGLDPFNASLAERKMEESNRTADSRVPEAYQWLLVPEQTDLTAKAEWQALRVTGQEALAPRAAKRLEREGLLYTSMAGAVLRLHLDRVLWTSANHVKVCQLKDYFAQYLYLPRLAKVDLVLDAIRDGVASTVWASETFAYASGYDEAKGRYIGLQAGRVGVVVMDDAQSLLVKPEVAVKQFQAEQAATATAITGTDVTPTGTATQPAVGQPTVSIAQPAAAPKPKRFYGSVKLNPQRVGRDAGKIAEEIVQHLALQSGAHVEVTLEIQAQMPEGAPDNVVRIVTENARTLKFIAQGFEPE